MEIDYSLLTEEEIDVLRGLKNAASSFMDLSNASEQDKADFAEGISKTRMAVLSVADARRKGEELYVLDEDLRPTTEERIFFEMITTLYNFVSLLKFEPYPKSEDRIKLLQLINEVGAFLRNMIVKRMRANA